jgi:anti-sigma factor RsiW
VDCKSFQELISAAVDRQLTKSESAAFAEHGRLCGACWYEYEAEAATKSVVRLRARRERTPELVAQRVILQIGGGGLYGIPRWFVEFVRKPVLKPIVGFALAFIAVILFLQGPHTSSLISQASLVPNDVILQSLMNHRAVLDGKIKPQVISSEPAQLESLFSQITDYSVHLPHMKNCRLVGGVQNEYDGTKLAHLVYQRDTDIVYVYQTCLATVLKGDKLRIPYQAREALEHTGWFTESEPDGRTVVLWERGRTLCVAVSRMSKDDLMACLTSDQDRW